MLLLSALPLVKGVDLRDILVGSRFSAEMGLSSAAALVVKDLEMFMCVFRVYTQLWRETPFRPEFLYALPSCRLCVLVVRRLQVHVITSVIRPGYCPPASK